MANPKFRLFIDALEQGVQYLINHPNESWELFIKKHPDLNDELNRRAWKDTIYRFSLRPGALDKKRYQKFGEFLLEQGLIDSMLPVNHYAIELE